MTRYCDVFMANGIYDIFAASMLHTSDLLDMCVPWLGHCCRIQRLIRDYCVRMNYPIFDEDGVASSMVVDNDIQYDNDNVGAEEAENPPNIPDLNAENPQNGMQVCEVGVVEPSIIVEGVFDVNQQDVIVEGVVDVIMDVDVGKESNAYQINHVMSLQQEATELQIEIYELQDMLDEEMKMED
eukprot:12435_1